MCEPVGVTEIAERLGRSSSTVAGWARDGVLPAAAGTVSGRPAWSWDDVEAWASEAGHLVEGEPRQGGFRRPKEGGPFEAAGYADVVARCAAAGGWSSVAEAAAQLGINHHTAKRALERCEHLGLVVRVTDRSRGVGYLPAGSR